MRPFEYASPTTKEQAVGLLGTNWGQAEILAGGTDLLALMKDDVVHPKRLVNIKDIKDLRRRRARMRKGLRIGALTTLGDLADNADVIQDYPALADALNEAASPQIRNMATLGGNLCQRPRCWYFRGGFGLLPKDESGKDLVSARGKPFPRDSGQQRSGEVRQPLDDCSRADCLRGFAADGRAQRNARASSGEVFLIPRTDSEREHNLRPNEIISEVVDPRARESACRAL